MKRLFLWFTAVLISVLAYSQTSEDYYKAGKAELDVKNIPAAITEFNKAIELDPNNEMALVSRALCRMSQGKWQMAIPDCDKAISVNPRQAVAYYIRGCAKGNLHKNGCNDLKKSSELGWEPANTALNKYCQ
jgi:tetratricopeptide (TPR) repeat protein